MNDSASKKLGFSSFQDFRDNFGKIHDPFIRRGLLHALRNNGINRHSLHTRQLTYLYFWAVEEAAGSEEIISTVLNFLFIDLNKECGNWIDPVPDNHELINMILDFFSDPLVREKIKKNSAIMKPKLKIMLEYLVHRLPEPEHNRLCQKLIKISCLYGLHEVLWFGNWAGSELVIDGLIRHIMYPYQEMAPISSLLVNEPRQDDAWWLLRHLGIAGHLDHTIARYMRGLPSSA